MSGGGGGSAQLFRPLLFSHTSDTQPEPRNKEKGLGSCLVEVDLEGSLQDPSSSFLRVVVDGELGRKWARVCCHLITISGLEWS
jgi:hypothetical protein